MFTSLFTLKQGVVPPCLLHLQDRGKAMCVMFACLDCGSAKPTTKPEETDRLNLGCSPPWVGSDHQFFFTFGFLLYVALACFFVVFVAVSLF